jgi:mono/diheme cytochrome c family protein
MRTSAPSSLHVPLQYFIRCAITAATVVSFLSVVYVTPAKAQDMEELQEQVASIFAQSCAQVGCHAGSDAQMGMNLERETFVGHTVGAASRERPDLEIVHPGNPDSSYLVMKVRGHEDIVGAPMPFTGNRLSEQEIASIENWIDALADVDVDALTQGTPAKSAHPFDGWKVVNVPTTRMVDGGLWFFLISHRFNPELSAGYDAFYGLDGSSIIFLNLGYAPTDDLLFVLGRSNASDNVELQAKYRFLQQTSESTRPVSLAAQLTTNWITEKTAGENRLRSEAFKFGGQLIASRDFGGKVGLLVAPGILLNQSESLSGEHVLVTLGLGTRWRFHRNLSLLAEWVPILSGYERTRTFGNENRFDSWGGGLEITVGGHVFQIIVTNSAGLTTDQYMRGGDLDITEPDMRLGFNIFRLLQF